MPVLRNIGLLARCLPLAGGGGWPPLHSAWLCPEVPLVFEFGTARELELGAGRLPQAAASSRSGF